MATYYCPSCLNTFQGSPSRCPNMGCGSERPRRGWGRILGPGDLIDRHYRIDRVLALGGAGLTYLARAVDAGGHPVPPELAIKVLFEERATGAFLRRLANEAQLLQDLDHDHIVRCRGFVQRSGTAPYLVTLFEHGGTLGQHLQRVGNLPPPVACGVLWQVLKALSMGHASGVVHRDLKPANVLLAHPTDRDVTPWVRVADFGIAKVSAPIGAGLTQAGTFVGTPEYAAPEQFEGLPPEPATDIFAAGGLLYFLLTGQPPIRLRVRGDPLACYEILLEQLPPQLPALGIRPEWQQRLQRVIDNVSISSASARWNIPRILEELAPLTEKPQRPKAPAKPLPPPDHRAARATMADWAPAASADATMLEPMGQPAGPLEPSQPTASPALPPAYEATILEAPGAPPARPVSAPVSQPRPSRPAPEAPRPKQALTLDDLFGSPKPEPTPPAPPPSQPRERPSDPFGFFDEPSQPAIAEPEPVLAQPEPARRAVPDAGRWIPTQPLSLPRPLPSSIADLLALLGTVSLADRAQITDTLASGPRPALSRAMRSWRPGGDPAIGRGAGLAIATLRGSDLASIARNLMRARDPEVRCCAAEALGAVAQGSLLSSLGRMLDDRDPAVRAAAARAIGFACERTGDISLGLSWLQRIAGDPDNRVAKAKKQAVERLEG